MGSCVKGFVTKFVLLRLAYSPQLFSQNCFMFTFLTLLISLFIECKDTDKDCEYWASRGECKKNPNWMLNNCKRSCQNC